MRRRAKARDSRERDGHLRAVRRGRRHGADGGRGGAALADLPAFCRVAATLTPTKSRTSRSRCGCRWPAGTASCRQSATVDGTAISIRMRLPEQSPRLRRHQHRYGAHRRCRTVDAERTEKLADWAYRSVHETAVAAKALINAFYGEAPKFSYFTGCSAGGCQAMVAAQRFPADFDGIVAGSPGLDWTSRAISAVRVNQAFERDPAAKVPAAKFAAINAAVMNACDANDGVKDGVLENPKACKFDPAVLACKGTPDNTCLTPQEIETVKAIYASPANPRASAKLRAWRWAARPTGPTLDGADRRAARGSS